MPVLLLVGAAAVSSAIFLKVAPTLFPDKRRRGESPGHKRRRNLPKRFDRSKRRRQGALVGGFPPISERSHITDAKRQ